MTTQAATLPAWRQAVGDDVPVFEKERRSIGRPFWWANRAHKDEAGFFMASPFEEETPWTPWETAQVFKNETHWKAKGLRIAPICWRTRPFYEEEGADGHKKRVFLPAWPETKDPKRRVQGYTEVLCFIRNDPDAQVWRMTGDGMIGRRYREMLAEYRKGLLGWARRIHGENVPSWTFWLPITGETKPNGEVFVTVSPEGGKATLPKLVFPKKPYVEMADAMYVGDHLFYRGVDLRPTLEEWIAEGADEVKTETQEVAE